MRQVLPRWSVLTAAVAACGSLTLLPVGSATAALPPPSTTTTTTAPKITGWLASPLGPVTSAAERAGRISIGRDGGYSVRLDQQNSLWIFGDTLVRGAAPVSRTLLYIPGSSAAIGPSSTTQAPTTLREVVVGSGVAPLLNKPVGPPFLPSPKDTFLPGGKGSCSGGQGHYSARWPTGAVRLDTSSNVLLSYVDVCVVGFTFTVEGYGIAVWSARTSTFATPPTNFVQPSPTGQAVDFSTVWMSPLVEADGSVDFFAVADDPTRPGASVVRMAHLPPGVSLTNVSNYVGRPLLGPLNGSFPGRLLHFAAYPGPSGATIYRAIGSRFTLGLATISTATSLTGPWSDEGTAKLPDCPQPQGNFCWSLIGHPELSSADAVVASYYFPGSATEFGHVKLLRFTPVTTKPPTTTTTTTPPK